MNWLSDREYVDPPTVPRQPAHRAHPARRWWLVPALAAAGMFCAVVLVVVAFSGAPSPPPAPVSAAAGARTSPVPFPVSPHVGLEVDEDGPRTTPTRKGCAP